MQLPPPEHAAVNAATGMLVGPVKVELAGVAKSTWNFQRLPEVERIRAEVQIQVGRARRWGGSPVEIGRQQTAETRAELEADLGGRGSGAHRCAI